LEKSFNERWSVGDNRGYLDNYAEEVSYFDPILKELIVGRDKVIAHLESIYSNPHIVRSEYPNPAVSVGDSGDHLGDGWPSATVQRRTIDGTRLIRPPGIRARLYAHRGRCVRPHARQHVRTFAGRDRHRIGLGYRRTGSGLADGVGRS